MKKNLLLLLCCGFVSPLLPLKTVSAQNVYEDVMYLKDGSMFRGSIKEQIPDSMVKIEIVGGNLITITSKQLDHIEYGKAGASRKPFQSADTIQEAKKQGYFNITEFGLMPGTNYSYDYYGYNNQSPVGINIHSINGYRFNPHLLIGGGVGLNLIQQAMMELYADARWEVLNRKATPYAYADAGYGFALTQKQEDIYSSISFKGGFSWSTGIGMRFNFHRDGAFLVSAGYKMMKRSEHVTSDWTPYETDREYTYNRVTMMVGLAF